MSEYHMKLRAFSVILSLFYPKYLNIFVIMLAHLAGEMVVYFTSKYERFCVSKWILSVKWFENIGKLVWMQKNASNYKKSEKK